MFRKISIISLLLFVLSVSLGRADSGQKVVINFDVKNEASDSFVRLIAVIDLEKLSANQEVSCKYVLDSHEYWFYLYKHKGVLNTYEFVGERDGGDGDKGFSARGPFQFPRVAVVERVSYVRLHDLRFYIGIMNSDEEKEYLKSVSNLKSQFMKFFKIERVEFMTCEVWPKD